MKIADPNPVACSVCLQPPMLHDPQLRHVDFEVAWDGPVLTHAGDDIRAETYTPISIDDLYICEDCLRQAAKLIGMEDAEEARARISELEQTVADKDTEIEAKDKAIGHADYTVGYLIDAKNVVKRGSGKPTMRGPEDKAKELKELRSDRVMREREAKKRRPKVKA